MTGPTTLKNFYGFLVLILWCVTGIVEGKTPTNPKIPQLVNQPAVTVNHHKTNIVISLGPLNVETGANNTIKHIFPVPRNVYLTGIHTQVSDSMGQLLQNGILHHISLLNLNKSSTFCPGAPYLIGGSGMDMSPVRFPKGYGIPLNENARLLVIGSFYHHTVSTENIRITLKLDIAEDPTSLKPLESYHISVTGDCYTKLEKPASGETEEGITLPSGVFTKGKTIQFPFGRCVKYAYPHVHDYVSLVTLENITSPETVLRTMPKVNKEGKLKGFQPGQIYSSAQGFPVYPGEDYQISMIYHRPLQFNDSAYGMASYLLYWTPLPC